MQGMQTTFIDCTVHGRQQARRTTEAVYRMMGGRRVEWGTRTVAQTTANGFVKCGICNYPGPAIVLDVTVTDTPCSEVCTSARGRKCECSCGGENHGA